jgi:hypothetical protein
MSYSEPVINDEEGNPVMETGMEYMQSNPMTWMRHSETAFVKHLTERHIPAELGDEHKKQWMHRLMYSGKERSTAFFEDPRSLQYINASRQNLTLIEALDIEELKWSQVYNMIDASVTTHGQHGNMIKSLTIKRQEFADKTKREESKGMLGGLFDKKQRDEQEDDLGVVRY